MIPDRLSELLTAYIDDELSARQRQSVQRLLHKSDEARVLLQKLQDDAALLRNLPRQRLEEDLSHSVLRTISDRADESAHTDFNRFIVDVASVYTRVIVSDWLDSTSRATGE